MGGLEDTPPSPGQTPTGNPKTNSAPGMPGDDPTNTPLGGVEWLAAAGAVYAARRLQKHGADESEDDDA